MTDTKGNVMGLFKNTLNSVLGKCFRLEKPEEQRRDTTGFSAEVNEWNELSVDEVLERLRLTNDGLINTIYGLSVRRLVDESERTRALDNKGNSLFAMMGAAFALVFSVGGLLIERVLDSPLPAPSWLALVVWTAWLCSLGTVFVSLLFGTFAIRVRKYFRTISDGDVFNVDAMYNDEQQEDVNHYKRYMIAHMWRVYKQNFDVNEEKAEYLKRAQEVFLGAISLLVVLAMFLGILGFWVAFN